MSSARRCRYDGGRSEGDGVTVQTGSMGVPSSIDDSLSDYDRAEVLAATRLLPGKWSAQFNMTAERKSYACIRRTESGASMTAFLLKRHDGLVVLIDRLSDRTQNLTTRHQNMTKAMRVVFAAVLANSTALDPEIRN
jgi:hypothetical protein